MQGRQGARSVSLYTVILALSLAAVVNPVVIGAFVSPRAIVKAYVLLFDLWLLGVAALAFLHVRTGRAGLFRCLVAALAAGPLLLIGAELALGYVRTVHLNDWRGRTIENLRRPDLETGWSLIPGAAARDVSPGNFDVVHRIDDQGRKAVPQGAAELPRLLVFGDSFTFGLGVANEETHLNLLAERYRDRLNVLNYGVDGYGLEQIFMRFRRASAGLRPGDRVLFTPMSYDLLRSVAFGDVVCAQIFKAEPGTWRLPAYRDGAWHFVDPHAECGRLKALLQATTQLPLGWLTRRLRLAAMAEEIAADADAIFAEAAALARAAGAEFHLVFFLHPEECGAGGHSFDVARLATPHASLLEFCPDDPAEIRSLHFPSDGHWSAEGHRWAAAALHEILAERLSVVP